MDVMPTPPRRSLRSSIELSAVVSTVAVAATITLRSFAGVGEAWIVGAVIATSTLIGFLQPAARLRPARARSRSRLHPAA